MHFGATISKPIQSNSSIDEMSDKRAMYLRVGLGIFISLFRSLLIARILVPNDMIAFRIGTSWVGYFGFITLGAVEAFIFRAPGYWNVGDDMKAMKLQGVALAMTLGSALIAGFGTILLAFSIHLTDFYTSILLAFNALLSIMFSYLSLAFWAKSQFKRQARIELMIASAGLIFGMGGLMLWGLRGLLLGGCLSYIGAIWFTRDMFPFKTIRFASLMDYFDSIKFGIKQSALIFLQGLVGSFDLQVLAIMIVGSTELGIYSFATMLAVAIKTVASAGAAVSAKSLLTEHGNETVTIGSKFHKDIEQQRRLDNALVTIISLSSYAIIVAFSTIAFPRYANMVEPLAGLVIGIITLRWGYFHAFALMMRSQQWKVIPTVVLGTIINAIWVLIGIKMGWSLQVIALAPAFGAGIYSILTLIICEYSIANQIDPKNIINMILLMTGPVFVLLVRADHEWYINLSYVILSLIIYIFTLAVIDKQTLYTTIRFILVILGIGRIIRIE